MKEEEQQAAFEEYGQTRLFLKQLRQQQKQQRFGQMVHMHAAQLVREVSHAPAAASVVVHMFNPRLQVSEQLQVSQRRTAVAVHPSPCFHPHPLLQQLAAAFAGTKFVSMVFNNCAPD